MARLNPSPAVKVLTPRFCTCRLQLTLAIDYHFIISLHLSVLWRVNPSIEHQLRVFLAENSSNVIRIQVFFHSALKFLKSDCLSSGVSKMLSPFGQCLSISLPVFGSFGLSTKEPCTIMLCPSCLFVQGHPALRSLVLVSSVHSSPSHRVRLRNFTSDMNIATFKQNYKNQRVVENYRFRCSTVRENVKIGPYGPELNWNFDT